MGESFPPGCRGESDGQEKRKEMETGVYAGVIYLTSEEQGMKEGKRKWKLLYPPGIYRDYHSDPLVTPCSLEVSYLLGFASSQNKDYSAPCASKPSYGWLSL